MRLSLQHNLLAHFPEIAKEWDYEANFPLMPEDVAHGSGKKAWWLCCDGHRWITSPNSRTSMNTGCPCCSGRSPTTINNLLVCFPEIAAEWDYEANFPLRPEGVTPKSGQKPGWKCEKNPTHRWVAAVNNRTGKNKTGCPYCAGYYTSPEHNLLVCFPEISAEWDYDANGDLRPENVTPKSHQRAGWKCDKRHRWSATVSGRTSKNRGCPTCARAQHSSTAEVEIYEHVLAIYQDAIPNDLSALGYFELDTYVPSLKKAIEYDGVWWHDMPHNAARDRRKDARCIEKGVQLLRITDTEYTQNKPATLAKIEAFLNAK